MLLLCRILLFLFLLFLLLFLLSLGPKSKPIGPFSKAQSGSKENELQQAKGQNRQAESHDRPSCRTRRPNPASRAQRWSRVLPTRGHLHGLLFTHAQSSADQLCTVIPSWTKFPRVCQPTPYMHADPHEVVFLKARRPTCNSPTRGFLQALAHPTRKEGMLPHHVPALPTTQTSFKSPLVALYVKLPMLEMEMIMEFR